MHFSKLKALAVSGLTGISVFVGFRKWQPTVVAENVSTKSKQVPGKVPAAAGARAAHDETCAIPDNMELILVQIFFRHGARTPLRILSSLEELAYDEKFHDQVAAHTDLPYVVRELSTGGPQPKSRMDDNQLKISIKGGMKSGQLTTIGREQTYLLGKRLEKRYIEDLGFIDALYDSKEVYVRSTNVRRCVQSLRCVVSGMFGADQFKENGSLVIPVKHMYHEDLYPNLTFCETLRHKHANNPELLMKVPIYTEAVTKVQTQLGEDPALYTDMMMVRDNLIAAKTHGLQVPIWLLEMENDIRKAAVVGIEYFVCGGPEHRKALLSLACGRIYDMIGKNMEAALTDRKSIQKFHLYSCHDTSVFPLLVALEYPVNDWPPYAADIRYELYQDRQKQPWVKISYCGKDFTPPGCNGPLIPFSKFQDLVEPYALTHDQYKLGCNDLSVAREFARMPGAAEKMSESPVAPPMM